MSLLVTLNGSNYIIPQTNEVGWGSNLDDYFVAIAAGVLQKTGGSFTLSAETDFGSSYGLKSLYYKSRASNVAATGAIRLANAETGIVWRNALNNADLPLTVNSSNQLSFNGTPIQSNALTSAHILVGSAGGVATDVAMTGDISIDNTGLTAIGAGKIVNAQINASAAIAYSKLALTGSIVNADVSGSAAIAYSKLNLGTSIVNADVSASAAIAYSKLNLSTSIVNADINASAAIAYSKLALTGAILNADLAGSIAYGKLVLTNSIVNADISSSAAIAYSKLALTGAILNADLAGSIAYSKLVLTGAVVNADISTSAAIARSKIAAGTAWRMLANDTAGAITEIGFGSSGQVLTSTGATSLPTFQNVAGTGTVNSGTAGRLSLYATSTNAVSDTYVQNSQNINIAIAAHAALAATRTYTIPEAGADASFIMSAGTQTIGGAKTFSSGVVINPSSTTALNISNNNALVVDSTNARVGIGTASPLTAGTGYTVLQIQGISNSNAGVIRLVNPDGANGLSMGQLLFTDLNGGAAVTGKAIIEGIQDGAHNSSRLEFTTMNAGTIGATPAMIINKSGQVLIGPTTANTINAQVPSFQIESTASANARPSIILNVASAACPLLTLGKTRGATNGTYTIVNNGDFLGGIYFFGANGVDLSAQGAAILTTVVGTPSATSMPTKMELSTCPVGATSALAALTLNPDQTVNVTAKNGLQVASTQVYPVVQVVSTQYVSATTTASASFVDTNLSISITPKFNTSKIVVHVSGYYYNDTSTASNTAEIQLATTGGYASTWAYRASSNPSGGFDYANAALTIYINPTTTSAITIKVQIRRNSGTGSATFASNQSSLVAVEYAQ